MDLQIKYNGKTFVADPLGEAKLGAYVLCFSDYCQGHAFVGQVERIDDTGVLFLHDTVINRDQRYMLLKEDIDVGDLIEEEEEEDLDDVLKELDRPGEPRYTESPRAPRPAEQLPTEPTPQERQLEQWTTTRIVFSHSLKKGVPYAIKRRHSQEPLYGLYSGLLDPVTALFRYLNGEHKVTIQQLESGIAEIHEIVEDVENKEEF